MNTEASVYVAGHKGMVGSAIVRKLVALGFKNVITRDRAKLDLTNQAEVKAFFKKNRIDLVFMAAARVGGILANSRHQADFLYENLIMAANVIHAAAESNVRKLLFLGSSCVYPRMAPQPIREDSLLSGPLESTNEGYAIAKIAGIKLCEMYYRQYGKCFISAMPTNLYGSFDDFHPMDSHVIPGMMRRFHEAKVRKLDSVSVWGSGTAMREFLHVDDLADALLLLMDHYESPEIVNVGTGTDCSIRGLSEIMKDVVTFAGKIEFDRSKPDGTPRKLLDVTRIRSLGWEAQIALRQGLRSTYEWACTHGVFA